MKKYLSNSWMHFPMDKVTLKIIKAGVYSDFRRTAPASNYPQCRVN